MEKKSDIYKWQLSQEARRQAVHRLQQEKVRAHYHDERIELVMGRKDDDGKNNHISRASISFFVQIVLCIAGALIAILSK